MISFVKIVTGVKQWFPLMFDLTIDFVITQTRVKGEAQDTLS